MYIKSELEGKHRNKYANDDSNMELFIEIYK